MTSQSLSNFTGDSDQTQLRSICLKFTGPIIRITRQLPGRLLRDEYIAPVDGKKKVSTVGQKILFYALSDVSKFLNSPRRMGIGEF